MRNRFVCLDLEMSELNLIERQMTCGMKNEVIQIGAIMLDENYNMISEFQSYVKPRFSSITSVIHNLTGINEENLLHADDFITAFDKFCYWLGNDDVTVFCWSNTDYNQLWDELHLKAVHREDLFKYLNFFVDLQSLFCKLLGSKELISLESALLLMQLDFEGKIHNAICDAFNTGRIVHKLFCSENLNPKFEYIAYQSSQNIDSNNHMNSKKEYTTSFAAFLSPELQKEYGYIPHDSVEESIIEEDINCDDESYCTEDYEIANIGNIEKIKILCQKYKVKICNWFSFIEHIINTDEMIIV